MTTHTDELFCVLLALEGERLLLPRQALVEAVAWVELLPMPGAPAWYPGTLEWAVKRCRLSLSRRCSAAIWQR